MDWSLGTNVLWVVVMDLITYYRQAFGYAEIEKVAVHSKSHKITMTLRRPIDEAGERSDLA